MIPPRRILLLGKEGQLGWELQCRLPQDGSVTALDYPEIDFLHPNTLPAVVKTARPDIIINAVGYTDVDRAESEPENTRLLNADGPGVVMEAARETGALMVHISSDYVFDGEKGSAYQETDPVHPISLYGQTKLDGELAVQQAGGAYLILRTSWMYSQRRANFMLKVLEWARKYEMVRIAADQTSNPTSAAALAQIIVDTLATHPLEKIKSNPGIYHVGGNGWANRFEWAKAILDNDPHPEEWKLKRLETAAGDAFPTPARRPRNSSMQTELFWQTFGLRLPPWQECLRNVLNPKTET